MSERCPSKAIQNESIKAYHNTDDNTVWFSKLNDVEDDQLTLLQGFKILKALLEFLKFDVSGAGSIQDLLRFGKQDRTFYSFKSQYILGDQEVMLSTKLTNESFENTIFFPEESLAKAFYDSLN